MFSSFMRVLVNPVDALVFQPPSPTYSASVRGALVPEANLVCVDRANGFYCVEFEPSEGTKPSICIVWVHGNACDCGEESAAYLNIACALNVAFVAAEFPGYGVSPGIASEDGVDRAVQATYEFARAKPHIQTIIMAGRSVGTGPVCRLARNLLQVPENKLGALVLWSAIVSIKDQCANLAGSVVSSFLGDRWSPVTDLPSVACPVLFIAGENDSLTTPVMCERLRRACIRTDAVFVHVSEIADHNEGWDFILDVIQPIARLLDHLDAARGKQDAVEEQVDPVFVDGELPEHAPHDGSAAPSATLITPNDKAEICIIGCGPVGLFVACNLIHRGFPGDGIVCVDKYATFQRSHVLRLEPQSVANAPKSLVELIKGELGVTRTNAIEEKLAEECRSKQVAFMRPFEVKDVPDFVARFVPNAKTVICCDGSHSVARRELFGGLERRYTLEYVLDCRGEVVSKEKPSKLSLPQFVDLLGKITHIGEESVGRKTNSSSDDAETWPVTFRLLITGEEMRAIRSSGKGTARNPLVVDLAEDTALLPAPVYESISKWRNTRARLFEGETILNLKCVAVDLNCYRARQYVALGHPKCSSTTFLLCGDAAFGVPFFRALNNGLLCASECARTIMDLRSNPAVVQTQGDLVYHEGTLEEEDTERPREYKGMLSRSFGASMASAGLGAQVSQILAHASFEQGVGMLLPESQDPARRYDDFVKRLARKEFAVAGSKRDGLEITKFANLMRNTAAQAVDASVQLTSQFVSSSLA